MQNTALYFFHRFSSYFMTYVPVLVFIFKTQLVQFLVFLLYIYCHDMFRPLIWPSSGYNRGSVFSILHHYTPYLLTPWSKFLLEKLTSLCSQSSNSPHFMEPESSLPYSQVPATRHYPEPTPSSPHDPLKLPEHPF
jgi:hypothetical protein